MEKMQVIKPSVSEGKMYIGRHITSIYIASYINFKKEYKQTTCTSIKVLKIYIYIYNVFSIISLKGKISFLRIERHQMGFQVFYQREPNKKLKTKLQIYKKKKKQNKKQN